jgi:hypothetical protein
MYSSILHKAANYTIFSLTPTGGEGWGEGEAFMVTMRERLLATRHLNQPIASPVWCPWPCANTFGVSWTTHYLSYVLDPLNTPKGLWKLAPGCLVFEATRGKAIYINPSLSSEARRARRASPFVTHTMLY